VPVLTYHRVAALSATGLTDLKVDPGNFIAELAALHDAGYHTIHQSELFDALYRGAALPPKPVIISVDDGYVDDVTRILPALERYHMVATFFVITGRFTIPGFMTADQVRELDQAGMDVGDHTAHHVDLRRITATELTAETAGSRQTL
jgi:peptidoglycan/xylan/chitin deacetylase (PgdA/CDA1 family)